MAIKITQFYDYLIFEKGYSTHTADAYLQDLKILFALEKDITKIDNKLIQTLVMQQNSKNYSARSIKRLIASISNYMNFLFNIGELKSKLTLDITTPKVAKNLPKYLGYEDVMLLIAKENGKNEDRDILMLVLMYACALRVGELVALNKNDIDFNTKFIKIFGKGNKERYTPIGEKALKFIKIYLNQRTDDNSALFINRNLQRISTRSVQNMIKNRAALKGFNFTITPHMLRHAAATHLLQSSNNLRATQEFLGHKNLSSTQIYTHLSSQELAYDYEKYHPHAKKN